ncbi:MAG: TIGR03960 family B12-binding radical SAM protein [Candidatus Scalindua sp. AMX11]|nr:MAG: TIGR03960 family B12-binding radical SAM protein [Candidatus Scalindua sp.]NOG84518.1 TIGR03960 family B12-binding radical SAM protein [Planctomycetota bacterium]RZV80474.1 MAG: TIGR03960 family B12-binding radical SAM protein [Candidatus Scalindua sp. SCAELEC01]TDE65305.1 MAG: TIGR03960 family B12-binding radical SAM protein [Candidatus Scalindua sp. AMX11]
MNNVRKFVEENILSFVETPGQYIGGEWNSITKEPRDVEVTVALAFPDTYAIGMSHLGMQIIYGLLNDRDDTACERVFAPWPDMEEALRKHDVPLYTLETFTPLREVDIIGFSLQYEMSYTNVLNMLDLAKIPLRRQDRSEDDPLIMAGGPVTLNPEPMSDFIDLFFIGEGEEVFIDFIEHFKAVKQANGLTRDEKILSLVKQLDNLYAPSLYDVTYEPDGVIKEIVPKETSTPSAVQSATVQNLDTAYFPKNLIVPFVQTIHDRISIEVMRGCTQGCRFCQAGMTKRPNRIRSVDTILKLSEECYRSTGHDEISLGALSISDYPHLKELMEKMGALFSQKKVNISFPSLRISDQLTELPSYLNTVRKSSLTLAPEAATKRLRKVINKDISNEDLFNGVREAFKEGWKLVKLYFMVGLPTETDEDIEAIVDLSQTVSSLRKEVKGVSGDVNVTIAPFVPKSHTPFQWGPMVQLERINEIKLLIRKKIRSRKIKIKFNKPERSFLEGVFARGDRRLGSVILKAWSKGCKFDAWDEHFNYDAWNDAFKETGIDTSFYVYRERKEDEIFPWDHINTGVVKQFFQKENDKSFQQQFTPDCFKGSCPDCGACVRSSHYVGKILSQLT